ncbi:MAG: two-component system sensor histidine kinase NtrB [Phycisphaerales bacterium]
MTALSGLLLGFALGALAALGSAWWVIRRHVRRVRAAERRARAAERMAEIGAMTGGLAHEIKNPLSTIGLNAQLLAEGVDELAIAPEDRGRLSRRVAALRREVDRLRGILTDFLQFAGHIRLDPKPADLNAVVEELVDFFLPQAEKQGVRLRPDLSPGPLVAPLDAPQFKQAVLNLMLNAVQAMSEPAAAPADAPGAAARSDAAPRAKELILRTTPGAGPDGRPAAVLHVIDTGSGIPPETLARLFEPYFTTKSGGTGLGLPTARRLVEAHGGTIDVRSEPGRGTDFVVTVPMAPVAPSAP